MNSLKQNRYLQDCMIWLKVDKIGTKWDKSRTFSDQFSVHFGSVSQNILIFDLKKFQTYHIWWKSDPILAQIHKPCVTWTLCEVTVLLRYVPPLTLQTAVLRGGVITAPPPRHYAPPTCHTAGGERWPGRPGTIHYRCVRCVRCVRRIRRGYVIFVRRVGYVLDMFNKCYSIVNDLTRL